MSVKTIDNTQKINQQKSISANIFLRNLSDEVIKISTPKTPKKFGNLRRDIIKSVLGLNAKIKWAKNYAVFQETKQFINYTTSGTGPHFAENAVKKAIKNTPVIARRSRLI